MRRTWRIVLAALRPAPRGQGPLTDAQLGWWLRHFEVTPEAARAARQRLTRRGLVRQLQLARPNGLGALAKLWEAKG
jgi:hypothetical protein